MRAADGEEAVLGAERLLAHEVGFRERDLVVGEHVALGGQGLDKRSVLRLDLVLDVGQAVQVRGQHELELADLVLDVHALCHGGVALGDLLHLGERQHGLVQVVHRSHGRLVGEDLADEALLALDDGVQVAVERAGRDVAEVVDAVEGVALADDAAEALFEVGRPPRAVEVVDRGQARLHVRPGAQRRGRAQQDADVAAAHLLVQRLLLLRLALGVGHAGDLGLGDAGLDEAAAHVVLDVPAPGGGRG